MLRNPILISKAPTLTPYTIRENEKALTSIMYVLRTFWVSRVGHEVPDPILGQKNPKPETLSRASNDG